MTEWADALGPRFSLYRSDHFDIHHNVSGKAAVDAAQTLESVMACVRRFLTENNLPAALPHTRLQVVFADRWSALPPALPGSIRPTPGQTGLFDPLTMRSYFVPPGSVVVDKAEARTAAAAQSAAQEANRLTVAHEGAHQVLAALSARFFSNAPHWLSEGIACLLEVPCAGGADFIPSPNPWRAADLPPISTTPPAEKDPSANARPPLAEIIAEPWNDLLESGTSESRLYARSWSLVYYLRSQRRDAFSDYLRALASSPTPLAPRQQVRLFESHFGPPNDTMDQEILRHARNSTSGPKSKSE